MTFPPIVHWALESSALTIGGLCYWKTRVAAAQPTDVWVRWGILAGAAAGAALGSRALYILQYWSALAHQPLGLWLGGKTLVGGLLGAVIGVEWAKRLLRWPSSTGDGFVVPVMVAIAVGRVGCQLSGLSDLTYGNPTSLPWGWNYGDGIPRHPTALYEILGLVLIAFILRWARFTTRPGDRFRAFMVGYLVLRIGLDFLKPPFGAAAAGELQPDRYGPLSAIQWACVAGLAYYGQDLYAWATQGRKRA
jgi:phosphatidylglycerol:prolipoprotein diacylglycerol transferase